MTIPRRKNTTLSPINRCHLNTTAEHSWFEDHALYLVGPKRSCLLLAAETWRFHYEQRHDKIILLHDNARPHVSKIVKKYLETLKWNVLPHSPYSPDIAPSDYWLFRRKQVTDSLLSQKSKIGSKIGSPPKTSHFFEMEFKNCLRDKKK